MSLLDERLFAAAVAEPARIQIRSLRSPALRAQGQERHLPVHGRRAVAGGPLRREAQAPAVRRPGHPRRVRQGRAVRLHQGDAQAAGLALYLQAVRPVRRPRSPTCCRTSRASRTTSRSCARCTPPVQPRARPDLHEHRPPDRGPAQHGRLAHLRPGHGVEDLPGFVVLLSGENQPDGGKSCWGSGFLPSVYQGVEFRSKGDPVLFLTNPPGVRPGGPPRLARRAARDERRAPQRHRRPRDRHPHRLLRDGLPDADERPRADGHLAGARGHQGDVRGRAGEALLRQQLPARAPAGRARRALRAALPPRLGPPRHGQGRRHRQPAARPVPRDRPGGGRPGQGPEAARACSTRRWWSGAASSAARP